LSRGNPIEGFQ